MIPALADLPAAPRRVICHWTAGGHRANSVDLAAYHYVVEGDGTVRAGVPVGQNMRNIQGGAYAAHTRKLNSFSVGVALAGMTGARENGPYGPAPLLLVQMDSAVQFLARCCRAWRLDPADPMHLLTHAEVPDVYGVAQPGKWDITVLPWDPGLRGARAVGAYVRGRVVREMTGPAEPDLSDTRDPLPGVPVLDDPPPVTPWLDLSEIRKATEVALARDHRPTGVKRVIVLDLIRELLENDLVKGWAPGTMLSVALWLVNRLRGMAEEERD